MKTIFINISIILFLLNNSSFPQFYADGVISDYIVEFWKIADETTSYQEEYRKTNIIFSPEELEHIARLYYKCYNDNPVDFQKYVDQKHKEWEKAPLDVVTGKIKLRPWMKVYALRDRLINKFGDTFVFVNGTPAFIRGKFILVKTSSFDNPELKSTFGRTDYIFLIEEIIKNDKFFSSGDTIACSFIHNADYPGFKFKNNISYLIPIKPWIGSMEYHGELTFQAVNLFYRIGLGSQVITFPIENEIIQNCEYFGIKDTCWTDFKKYFKETYLKFE